MLVGLGFLCLTIDNKYVMNSSFLSFVLNPVLVCGRSSKLSLDVFLSWYQCSGQQLLSILFLTLNSWFYFCLSIKYDISDEPLLF